MTSWVVVDSSILLAKTFTETFSAQADAIWQDWDKRSVQIAAPTLFQYEIVAAVRKQTQRGNIAPQDAEKILDGLLAVSIQLFISPVLLRRAYELAAQLNQPTAYDSQYLAVAEHLKCDFWTADEKLVNAVQPTLPYVRWIRNFSAS